MSFTPNPSLAGSSSIQFNVNDLGNSGMGGPLFDTDNIAITVLPVNSAAVWLSTLGAAAPNSGPSWSTGTVMAFGDPAFDLEPGTTSGTFSAVFNINAFGTDGGHSISALHLVQTTITLGGVGGSFTLQQGDLLFSLESGSKTINGITFDNKDLMVFRPSLPGNYASGTFTKLLDDPSGVSNIREIALVESPLGVMVGNVQVAYGDFLLVQSGGADDDNIYVMHATTVGAGSTNVTAPTLLVDGSDLGIDQQIGGLELIPVNLQAGGVSFQAGQLLLSVRSPDTVAGVAVTEYDVFALTLTTAGSNTNGTATLIAEGVDLGIGSSGEEIRGLTLSVDNVAPLLFGANHLPDMIEDPFSNFGVSVSYLTTGQFYDTSGNIEMGVALTSADNSHGKWQFSLDNGSNWTDVGTVSETLARLLPADSTARLRFVPNANWNGGASIAFRAWDETIGTVGALQATIPNGGQSAFSTAIVSATITVTPVNDAPTINNNSSLSSNSFNLAENIQTAMTLSASDIDTPSQPLTFNIIGGTEASFFNLDANSGKLQFKSKPDFEQPSDVGSDRVYEVIVQVSDGLLTDTQTVTIAITDANDAPVGVSESYTLAEDSSLAAIGNWFDPNWSTFQKLTFNNTSATNLVDQVILVTLDASTIDYSKTQNAGQDLRFVDANGTLLSYEIDVWNETGTSQVWVRVPQIDALSSTDFIRMYYGNATAIAGQNPNGVWESSTRAVLHMANPADDSTVNSNTVSYSGTTNSAGRIGAARNFDGVDDSVNVGSATVIDNLFTGGGTISAWINPEGWGEGSYGRIADKANSTFSSGTGNGWGLYATGTGSSGRVLFHFGFSGHVGRWSTAMGAVTTSNWQMVTVVYDSSSTANDPQIFINGVSVAVFEEASPDGSPNSDAALNLTVGNHSVASSRTFQGAIDEFRAYEGSLSAAQIHANFLAVNGGLTTLGPAQTHQGVLTNDSDQDGNPLMATLGTTTSNGKLLFNSNGSFTYSPFANYFGSDSFTYVVEDGSSSSNPVTVSLFVTPVNDAPIITSNGGSATASITIAENNSIPAIVTSIEVDSDSVMYKISGGADASWFSIDQNNGTLIFSPSPSDYEAFRDSDKNNIFQVEVTATDSTGLADVQMLMIQVTDQDEFDVSPIVDSVLSPNQVLENAANGTAVGIDASAVDLDGTNNTITYSLVDSADGRFSINAFTGVVRVADSSRIDRESSSIHGITVRASSTDGSSSIATFAIDILPVNEFDPVITSSRLLRVSEKQVIVDRLAGDDLDLPTPSLSFTIVGGVDRAKFRITNDNDLAFVSPPNFENPGDANRDNFYEVNVEVSDGSGRSTVAAITVMVENANDAPVARDHSYTVLLGSPFNVAAPGLLQGVTDEDGHSLTVALVGSLDRVSIAPDGSFVYTPSADVGGQESFTYEVSDGNGGVDTGTVFITIATLQQPVISSDSITTTPPPPSTISPESSSSSSSSSSSASSSASSSTSPPATSDSATPVAEANSPVITNQIAETQSQTSNIPTEAQRGLSTLAEIRVAENVHRVQRLTERLVESSSQQGYRSYRAESRNDSLRTLDTINDLGFSIATFNAATDIVWQDIDSIQQQIDVIPSIDPIVMGAATGLTSTLSVGYVVWLVRGGYIVAGVMTQLPAWRIVDPLPVLNQLDDPEYDGDDDSLESMVASSDADADEIQETEQNTPPAESNHDAANNPLVANLT